MSRRTETQSPTVTTAPALFDTKSAAAYLGKSKSFLIKSRCEGKIKGPRFAKIGGVVVYRRIDLDSWVDSLV
ncbi:MAG: helix-turn-helix domain-containing protein, partial [Synergistaceae bacterium]|nr:helix-turn-helix domain-containing protein [Synergistaceae bacterium]